MFRIFSIVGLVVLAMGSVSAFADSGHGGRGGTGKGTARSTTQVQVAFGISGRGGNGLHVCSTDERVQTQSVAAVGSGGPKYKRS